MTIPEPAPPTDLWQAFFAGLIHGMVIDGIFKHELPWHSDFVNDGYGNHLCATRVVTPDGSFLVVVTPDPDAPPPER